jgi:hypothetical protein
VKRLTFTVDEGLDARLAAQATLEGVSKAALVRGYLRDGLRTRPPIRDPLEALIGSMTDGERSDASMIDDVVYRRPAEGLV